MSCSRACCYRVFTCLLGDSQLLSSRDTRFHNIFRSWGDLKIQSSKLESSDPWFDVFWALGLAAFVVEKAALRKCSVLKEVGWTDRWNVP